MRLANRLHDMDIDEVSLVDKDANGYARMLIAKNDSEDQMGPDELTFSEEDLVYDDSGNAYLPISMSEPDNDPGEDDSGEDMELDEDEGDGDAEQVTQSVLAGLSKALGDSDRDQYVAKAYGEIAKANQRAARAEAVAKAERDMRLEREYIAKAAEYEGLPVPANVLGPVLKRCTESLSKADCEVLAQCLDAAANASDRFDPYSEIGKSGGGDNLDILAQVSAEAEDLFSKGMAAGTGFTREQSVAKVFEDNPYAYDQYMAERRNRNIGF